MGVSIKGITKKIAEARFSYLFFSIVLLFLLRPLLEDLIALRVITDIFIWSILISCGWAVHDKRIQQVVFLGIVVIAIVTNLLDLFLDNRTTDWASKIVGATVFAYVVVVIFMYLIRQDEVTADMIMAAASEYIMIGILFSFIYALIEAVHPGSFSLPHRKLDRSSFLYFSFVTLTTTGYGDIVPVSLKARTFATLEQITGQLYMALTVARLVGLYAVKKERK